ncbi:GDSL-type esterase/lipase family protein [Enterobacter roggenkampii]|uniref:GDSL-type esterase/lipase family protein n=1 Tax=Enterobacter roggenkampii TaxID=1812935 RepID=UPI001BDFCAF4|nr:GDSL-type esterase/lipase family protein [Enterobacter roggenkampii]MBT2028922.1 hypothetical protein [Enterobacter roggenkampii]MBT2033459.1 hypothetical protein [Enterobacter roggenkampii]
MATQPTNLPVPSESPRDLKFNAGKIDEFVTSMGWTYTDRFGVQHYTIEGLRWLAQQAIAAFGYITIDSFQEGATLTLPNQVLRWKLPDGDGDYYRWDGSFGSAGKVVPAGSTPATAGGIGPGAWLNVGYAALKQQLASAADGMGDNLVAVKQPFTGSKATTVHQKMREIIAINDGSSSGAEPDGVTDCSSALLGLVATVNPVVRLPFIPGTANVYYFSTFDPDALQGVTFDVDRGVKLSVPNDWLAGKASAQNIKFIRATQFVFRSLNTEYTAMPGNNEVYAAKDGFLESYAFDNSEVQVIDAAANLLPLKISWPSSDTWVSDTFSAADQSSASMTVATGDNSFHIGFLDVLPGQEISACLLVNGTPQLSAVVRSSGGYSGIFASSTTSGIVVKYFVKNTGASPVETVIQFPMLNDHASYFPINSEWKIRVNSFNNYDILFNGYTVITINTPGYILDAGFGAFFNSGLSNPLVNIFNPVKIVNAKYSRNSFLAVKVFGDSISAPRVDCWPTYLKRELEFSEGLRAWNIINKAVPGDNVAGQLAVMQSVGVADADVVVIAIGTNDGQGQTDYTAFKSNLSAMVNICVTAGKPVILCKFGLWYTQTQAGTGKGQPSANYDKAFRYRNIVARVAAETGAKLLDFTEVEGPIAAYYVNSGLYVNMVGKGDSFVHDNIHPTTMATKVIARSVARSIMGLLSISRKRKASGMRTPIAMSNWSINSGDRPVRVDVSEGGVVSLSGIIFKSTGAVTAGTQIAQLPRSIAPQYEMQFSVYSDTAGVSLQVLPTGAVKIYGATTSTNFVGVSGLTWVIKQ